MPTGHSAACHWCPNKLVQLAVISRGQSSHTVWHSPPHLAAHLGEAQHHNSTGWETFGFVYVGSADLGSNAQHLPTPQQSAASAVGMDAQTDTKCLQNLKERSCLVAVWL